jgi:hypothetical protein
MWLNFWARKESKVLNSGVWSSFVEEDMSCGHLHLRLAIPEAEGLVQTAHKVTFVNFEQ